MGNRFRYKVLILLLCFLPAAALLHRSPSVGRDAPAETLAAAMAMVPGWRIVQAIPLDEKTRAALQVDDHVFHSFSDGREVVTLYVGQYFRAENVSAAHHPLVCFPGQGWEVGTVARENVRLANGEVITWATITARRGHENEFITYWFQAHDTATAGPFRQKVALVGKKLFAAREDNAFIRISFPVRDRTPADCRKVAVAFLNAFYPVYLDYVRREL